MSNNKESLAGKGFLSSLLLPVSLFVCLLACLFALQKDARGHTGKQRYKWHDPFRTHLYMFFDEMLYSRSPCTAYQNILFEILCCACCARCLLHNLSSSFKAEQSLPSQGCKAQMELYLDASITSAKSDRHLMAVFWGQKDPSKVSHDSISPILQKSFQKSLLYNSHFVRFSWWTRKVVKSLHLKKGVDLWQDTFSWRFVYGLSTVDEHRHYTNWSQQSVKSTLSKGLKTWCSTVKELVCQRRKAFKRLNHREYVKKHLNIFFAKTPEINPFSAEVHSLKIITAMTASPRSSAARTLERRSACWESKPTE